MLKRKGLFVAFFAAMALLAVAGLGFSDEPSTPPTTSAGAPMTNTTTAAPAPNAVPTPATLPPSGQ